MIGILGSAARFLLIVLLAGAFLPVSRSGALPAPGPRAHSAAPIAEVVDDPAEAGPAPAKAKRSFGQLPLYFVENQGQVDSQVDYYVQGSDKTIYFSPQGLTFALSGRVEPSLVEKKEAPARAMEDRLPRPREEAPAQRRWTVKLDFVGANPNVRLEGLDKTEAVISYFRGSPDEWHAGLPTYAKIIYRDLWPGIDLVYYGTVNRLKHEFVVHPGADPAQIRLEYRGATTVTLDEAGQLQVSTPLASFGDEAPSAYQENADGRHRVVEVAYTAPIAQDRAFGYGFRVGEYDPRMALVLDPATVLYCGYIGGSNYDAGESIAVDAEGNAYVTGLTGFSDGTFPVTVGPGLNYKGGSYDIFVAKVNAAGTALLYCGYIGGSGYDAGYGIAVDGMGNAHITGYTTSTEATFPVLAGPDLTFNGEWDAFVAKVSPSGASLLYCGYIGGTRDDHGQGIAVDGVGNAFVTGYTYSTHASFPGVVGPGLFHAGNQDAFVAKVNATGTTLLYCGYIGGSQYDVGMAIAVDGAGNAYVTGGTDSNESSFPEKVGPDLSFNGERDAFVAKVNPEGTALLYCGYIGGSGGENGLGIAVDDAGNAYVVGVTASGESTFPSAGRLDLSYNGGGDAFIAKVNASGADLQYCGYIGGNGQDVGWAIALDSAGNAYITGNTASGEDTFPVTNGPDLSHNGGDDVFVAMVDVSGAILHYCGYIGGNGQDMGHDIAVDSVGNAYVTGDTYTSGATFPVRVGPDLVDNGGYDAFVAKISAHSLTLTQPLQVGWNLISFSVAPISGAAPITRVAEVLSSIDGLYDAVLGYDQGAQSYYPDLPPEFNDLQELDPTHGYWIKMNQAATLRLTGVPVRESAPLPLDEGWNLVGYLPDEEMDVAAALASIEGQYTAVLGFHDGGAVSYYTELPPEFNDLQRLRPGHGYWIKATEATALTYAPITVELVSQLGGPVIAVAAQDSRAYVGLGFRLGIVDVTDPLAPFLLGRSEPLPALVRDLATRGSHAYVAAGPAGLRVLDVSDPARPAEIGSLATSAWANAVALAGDYAYLATADGLLAVSIFDPAHPVLAGSFDPPFAARDVVVANGLAYVLDDTTGGLRILDISTPAHPVQAGEWLPEHYATSLDVEGQYAYLVYSGWQIVSVDVSDPAHPHQAGWVNTGKASLGGIDVVGSYAYVAGPEGCLYSVDVSDPTEPQLRGGCPGHYNAGAVTVAGSYALVTDVNGGLNVTDISDPSAPSCISSYVTLAKNVVDVGAAGDNAFAVGYWYGLGIVDASDPASPSRVGVQPLDDPAAVAISGSHAYVVSRVQGLMSELEIVNISDPAQPSVVGYNFSSTGYMHDVAVAGERAYVAHDTGLRILDVSNVANPALRSTLSLVNGCTSVAVAGSYAYLTDSMEGRLYVADVSDPVAPTVAGSCDMPGSAQHVAIAGTHAYVADGQAGGLVIVDISDPAHPVVQGACDTPGDAVAVAVAGPYAYVADGAMGLRVMDISDPAHPVEVAGYDTLGAARAVALSGESIYVADGEGGLLILALGQ